jgi:hypothetical protein
MRTRSQLPSPRLSIIAFVVAVLVLLAPRMASAASHRTFFVAPGGSDAAACTSNSSATPFATIQKAIGCTAPGDAVSLAPSGAHAYPGIGEVGHDVSVAAQAGANARTVTIDAGQGELSVAPGASVSISGATLSCPGNDCIRKPTVTNEGELTLSEDAVSGNQSLAGGILNTTPTGSSTPASLSILDSTVSGNAGRTGGGVESVAGSEASGALTLRIVNSTIADNVALNAGGGVAVLQPTAGSTAQILDSTISGNLAQFGGGLYALSGLSLANTLVAANTVHVNAPDCQSTGPIVTDAPGGHNLIGDASGCPQLLDGIDGDIVGVSRPGLLALADNGGPTDTMALQSGSPAIGAGDPESCLAAPVSDLDQRGDRRRTKTRGCDIGAFDTSGGGGAIGHSFYVAPSGSDAVPCTQSSSSAPFATIQRALACTADGDVVNLAPSGSRPYPGIGPIGENVLVRAQSGANARTVTIDAGAQELVVPAGANATVSGVTLTCPQNDCSAAPTVTNEGTLTLLQDSLTDNLSGASAILNTTPPSSATPASLTIAATTVSGNGGRLGGGVASVSGTGASGAVTLSIVNSTIAQNVSQTRGGGIAATASTVGSRTTIVNSTISANTAQVAGGLYASTPLSLANTILAANTARAGTAPDCEAGGASVTDGPGGHNLIGNGSGCAQLLDGIDGDRVGGASSPLDPQLAPVAFDGGTTETAPPLPGSPAIAAGSAAVCLAATVGDVDQRGAGRNATSRNTCEIGSYDRGGKAPVVSAPTLSAPASASGTVAAPLAVTLAGAGSPTPAIALSGALPAGVTLSANGDGSATLAGTPAAGSAGVYQLTVSATNGVGPAASRSLTLTIAPLAVLSVSGQPVRPGRHRTITITGTGFQPGATLSASTPDITFSAVKVRSASTITARETVAAGAASAAYDLTVMLGGASATCSGCLPVSGGAATAARAAR